MNLKVYSIISEEGSSENNPFDKLFPLFTLSLWTLKDLPAKVETN